MAEAVQQTQDSFSSEEKRGLSMTIARPGFPDGRRAEEATQQRTPATTTARGQE